MEGKGIMSVEEWIKGLNDTVQNSMKHVQGGSCRKEIDNPL